MVSTKSLIINILQDIVRVSFSAPKCLKIKQLSLQSCTSEGFFYVEKPAPTSLEARLCSTN